MPAPAEFPRAWLRRYERGRRDGTSEAFAVVAAGFLGIALAPQIDRAARTAELGYAVVPPARGRGVATAALALLTDWALAELDPLRLELRITVDNHASKRVATRCGYAHEATADGLELWLRAARRGRRETPTPDGARVRVVPARR